MNINPQIKRQIENGTFNLSFHNVFSYNPSVLLNVGYERALELFQRRIGNMKFSDFQLFTEYVKLYKKISIAEEDIKIELENIVEESMRELYDIPGEINLKVSLVENFDINYDFKKQSQDRDLIKNINPERSSVIQKEINKRIILNSIVNGSSVMVWSNIYYLIKEKLEKLNPELIDLYDKYTAIVGLILYMQDPNFVLEKIQKNGICEVVFEEDEIDLKSYGVNVPALLLETNKVVFDYLISHSIPKDFTEDELKFYYAMSDNYEQEIWHNIISPTLYEKLLKVIDKSPNEIPMVIFKLCKLSYESLEEIFISIQKDEEEVKKILKLYGII